MVGFGSGAGFATVTGSIPAKQAQSRAGPAPPGPGKAAAGKAGASSKAGSGAAAKALAGKGPGGAAAKALAGKGPGKSRFQAALSEPAEPAVAAAPIEAAAPPAAASPEPKQEPAAAAAPAPEASSSGDGAFVAEPEPEPEPEPPPNNNGKVKVRYNHYNKDFSVVEGKLNWEHVDDEYAISFVFKGNWECHLVHEATSEKILPDGGALYTEMRKDPDGFDPDEEEEKVCGFFSGLTVATSDGKQKEYVLRVREDEALEALKPKTTYKAPDNVIQKGPKMESCSCIEGNPCVDAYCCKDWKNRFEVAKKHGWKGFS